MNIPSSYTKTETNHIIPQLSSTPCIVSFTSVPPLLSLHRTWQQDSSSLRQRHMAARWHTWAGQSVAAAAIPLLLLLRVEDSLAPDGWVKLAPAHPGSRRQSSTTTSTTTAAMVPVAAAAAVLAKAETAAAAAASGGGGGGRSAHTLTHPRGGRLALLVVRAFREGFPSAPPTAARRERSNLSIFPSSCGLVLTPCSVLRHTAPLCRARAQKGALCERDRGLCVALRSPWASQHLMDKTLGSFTPTLSCPIVLPRVLRLRLRVNFQSCPSLSPVIAAPITASGLRLHKKIYI